MIKKIIVFLFLAACAQTTLVIPTTYIGLSPSVPPPQTSVQITEKKETATPTSKTQVNKTPTKANKKSSETVKVPKSSGQMAWPVKGDIVKSFSKTNNGINIGAKLGTEVKASENGVVVYADDKLKGFGNLILIKHSDDFVTAYGHLDEIHVQKNQTLTRGQVIGTVGKTGKVKWPQLHFEIRKKTNPVDPIRYLP